MIVIEFFKGVKIILHYSLGKLQRTREYEIGTEISFGFSVVLEFLLLDILQCEKFLHIERMLDGGYLYQQGYTKPRQWEDV